MIHSLSSSSICIIPNYMCATTSPQIIYNQLSFIYFTFAHPQEPAAPLLYVSVYQNPKQAIKALKVSWPCLMRRGRIRIANAAVPQPTNQVSFCISAGLQVSHCCSCSPPPRAASKIPVTQTSSSLDGLPHCKEMSHLGDHDHQLWEQEGREILRKSTAQRHPRRPSASTMDRR